MPDIFVNYRTGDGNETAALLSEGLSRRFGEEAVFFAGRSIRPGERFSGELLKDVRRCDVLLAVIGRSWLSHPGLQNEDDWVRREILEAWQYGVRVIPVLSGREMGRLDREALPPELRHLAELQSLRIASSSYDKDLTVIGDELARLSPRLAERDSRAARPAEEPTGAGAPRNSLTGDNSGFNVQAGRVGDIGTVVTNPTGPVNTGAGTQQNHTHQPHLTGDGAAYVAGDNHGGISHRFGGAGGDEADSR
ncbi:toll/interleukin-1 receptor domain-containing protein [Streptomyces sp. NPDC013489]|uniref:toll/interleukin-1 receptor domain-containing protein n=1 Tax=Streptomyces sp. NPDC013489 TaxID=3155606 RepID=UPI0033FB08CD